MSSSLLAVAILFGAVCILAIAMLSKREKDYKRAMEKYEQDMIAYNAAMERIGQISAISAAAPMLAESHPAVLAFLARKGIISAAASSDIYMEAAIVAAIAAYEAETAVAEGEVKLIGAINDQTAAMVMAIVCDELKKSPSQLSFKSIKAL